MRAISKLRLSKPRRGSRKAPLILWSLAFVLSVSEAGVAEDFFLPFTSEDVNGVVKVVVSNDRNLQPGDIISQVVRNDSTSQTTVNSAADLLDKAIARRDSNLVVSVLRKRPSVYGWTQMTLSKTPVKLPATLRLPFDGSRVPSGVRVYRSTTQGLTDNDVISYVAKMDRNNMSPAKAMSDLLASAQTKKDPSNRVRVYNATTEKWITVTLISTSPSAADETRAIAAIKKQGGSVSGTPVTHVFLANTKLRDDDLVHLEGLSQIQYLDLSENQLTGAGLKYISKFSNLEKLSLGYTQVTDAHLTHVRGLKKLKELGLSRTNVTDAGIESLKGLTKLETLYVRQTQVTHVGARQLNVSLPECVIHR